METLEKEKEDIRSDALYRTVERGEAQRDGVAEARTAAEGFWLDTAPPIDASRFPNRPKAHGQLPCTIPNVAYMLEAYRITVRYNVIRKRAHIFVPGLSGSSDNLDEAAMVHIISLATLNNMATAQVPAIVGALADRHAYNPAAEWLTCKAWDGQDRLEEFFATIQQRENFPEDMKRILMRRWLISAVAAALKPSGFKTRGVLVLQGPQGIGKTAWVRSLVSDMGLQESIIKLDHHLDAGNKDSLLTAVSHWIVEIGELDSSFKRDVSRLKGFLTRDQDKIRRPYGRADSEYQRRTVFVATVNDHDFLVDNTGNTRWWTIPVAKIIYDHKIDMQQLFAQIAEIYQGGENWWLSAGEEARLEELNDQHRSVSALRERLLEHFDPDQRGTPNLPAMSASQLLIHIGFDRPTNPQAKECASILREFLGDPKKINGAYKWRIPLRRGGTLSDESLDAYSL